MCRDLAPHKRPYAHAVPPAATLLDAVHALRPTALIGVSSSPGAFSEPVVRAMAQLNARPIVMALSNPTSKAECTAADALRWSNNAVLFASGSPFAPVTLADGRVVHTAQANNSYIFGAIGLALTYTRARQCDTAMFMAAAVELAACVTADHLAAGALYPPLESALEISLRIAVRVAAIARANGWARTPCPADAAALRDAIQCYMFTPRQSRM